MSVRSFDTIIVWFRRELRVQDHLALWSAAKDAKRVVPLFIEDSAYRTLAPSQQVVTADAVAEVRRSLQALGGQLFVRKGEPNLVLSKLLAEAKVSGIYVTKDYTPARRTQDTLLRRIVESKGGVWEEFKDRVLFENEEIVSPSTGRPYTVFTLYMRAWKMRAAEIPLSLPKLRSIRTPDLRPGDLPSAEMFRNPRFPRGGEREALRRLREFLDDEALRYHEQRNLLSYDGTSRLSHHLATGTLSPRIVFHAIHSKMKILIGPRRKGLEAFLSQLIWREFYYQILANFPHVVESSFKPGFDRLTWSGSNSAFDAWREGQTGFPLVDAAMRQLKEEGWMHNRARMVVANFLTKDLHINWKRGESHFMAHLVDGDVALNNGGWQWCAGTGNDPQPWFRIFNPVLQSQKFDAGGNFIRRYVPELKNVPDRFIHAPWLMPGSVQNQAGCVIGTSYPKPIVDHSTERGRALQMYEKASARHSQVV